METDISINRNFVSKLGGNCDSCLQDKLYNSSYTSSSPYFNYIVNTMGVTYDQSLCYLICLQDKIVEACNCSLGMLPDYVGISKYLKYEDLQCVLKIATIFDTYGGSCNAKCPSVTLLNIQPKQIKLPFQMNIINHC